MRYLLKRKKNIILFFVLGLINKVLIHYSFFPIMRRSIIKQEGLFGNNTYGDPYRDTIGAHIEVIFTSDGLISPELHLFVPAYLSLAFIAWYFNDKIKAK